MKRYLFAVRFVDGGFGNLNYHEEKFECDADAMERARKILHESKRDCNAFQIDLFRFQIEVGREDSICWRHVVSYQ